MTDPIALTELTTGIVGGTGVFDKMMATTRQHLELEFNKNRIKGNEYATVYLGALDKTMAAALQFLWQRESVGLQADLLRQQILLAQVEVQKANVELLILQEQKLKTAAEIALLEAQAALTIQQKVNLVKDLDKTDAELLQMAAQTELTVQQKANSILEGAVLVAQECKLRGEYDLTMNTVIKTTSEIALLAQKTATERAQTQAMGVDPDSVIGKQKSLYQAQTDGFQRDAEQKVAKALMDTWSARRMSDEGTVADSINMLNDATIGRAVRKMVDGVNA